jgi:hypothetical protein
MAAKKKRTTKFPLIGEKLGPDDPVGVYTLILDELLAIDPKTYFQTSGEAVLKAEKLEKDVWSLAGKCRKLTKQLKDARGPSKYLEVTFENRQLVCRRKDPRKTKNKVIQAREKAAKKAAKKKAANKKL